MALSPWRFVHIYIIYTIIFVFLLVISYNILKRDHRNRLNQLLSFFHFSLAISLISNFIYASFSDPSLEALATLLHKISIYFIITGVGFLTLFTILLYKPDSRMAKLYYQIFFLGIYFIIGIGLFLIPDGAKIIILSDGTQLYPIWNVAFFIYYSFVIIPNVILSLVICFKIIKKIKLEPLAKRMRLTIIGLCFIYYMGLSIGITNFLNIPFLRNILTLTQLIPIIGVIALYYGVGISLKNLE